MPLDQGQVSPLFAFLAQRDSGTRLPIPGKIRIWTRMVFGIRHCKGSKCVDISRYVTSSTAQVSGLVVPVCINNPIELRHSELGRLIVPRCQEVVTSVCQ